MTVTELFEGKKSAIRAKKIWLKISDLFVELEDELRDIKDNEHAKRALERLSKDDLRGTHVEITKI